MVHWLVLVLIGLAFAVGGGFEAISTGTNPDLSKYASIGWGIGLVGLALIILGIVTKVKHLSDN